MNGLVIPVTRLPFALHLRGLVVGKFGEGGLGHDARPQMGTRHVTPMDSGMFTPYYTEILSHDTSSGFYD